MPAEPASVQLTGRAGGVELTVKVVPGASRSEVVGTWGSALKVAVAAPAERGRANAAVVKLLADLFGVKRAEVVIVSGEARPLKRVVVRGLTVDRARTRLS